MASPVMSIAQFMLKLRNQLNNVLSGFDGKSASTTKLKAQIVITCEQLNSLSPDNKSLLLALAIRPTTQVSPQTHHAFCAAVILSKLAQQFHFHSYYTSELISAALAMRIGLDTQGHQLSTAIYQRQKLNPAQQKHYWNYPLHSANYSYKSKLMHKNSIYAIMQHQELLDGSGYPKKLKFHQISHSGQLLSLLNKFVELITPRHQRAPFTISQSLSYLARRPQLYSAHCLEQLTQCLTQSRLGMIVNLPPQGIGLITSVNTLGGSMLVQHFDEVEGALKISATSQRELPHESITLQSCPTSIADATLFSLLEEHTVNRGSDACHSVGRLKPVPALASLFESLDNLYPEQDEIARNINALPALGDNLIASLASQYPGRRFNNSFHALQMAGFVQSRPLLAILALRQQLACYQFPALAILENQVDSLLFIARHISEYTTDVLPDQLAMFVLLNVAPLYFDQRIHQVSPNEKVALNDINPLHAAGLFGLTNNPKQTQIINTLARFWEGNKAIKQLLLKENDTLKGNNLFQAELMAGYQLSLILTQHIYRGVGFKDPSVNAHLKSVCRKLKISANALEELCQLMLTSAPRCPLD